jgi:hypothetical protein
MDDDLRQLLFHPEGARRLVLARRPPSSSPLTCVVSDVVWQDVVQLLRWAAATTSRAAVDTGRWWRLAGGCADLLRRLPSLCDEVGEAWGPTATLDDPDLPGAARVTLTTGRLAALLRTTEPVPLRRLAGEVDALGAAAISALAQGSSWTVPGTA